jgi:hypothetical protein
MDRRDFLKTAGMAAGGALGTGGLAPRPAAADGTAPADGPQPNILFILVDEMRFPSVFPQGVKDAGEFLARYMPNVHSLWRRGVKFSQHFTAASACTPSRGVLVTGLYNQQSWLGLTLTNQPLRPAITPPLNPAYPTYGKLLRRAGYRTPYVGKWHVSFDLVAGLEPYGFQRLTLPDPVGYNLQGAIGQEPLYPNDKDIAEDAVRWLGSRRAHDEPWCLTVSFVNPHDQEFFWIGTEFQTCNDLFANSGGLQQVKAYSTSDSPPVVSWDDNPLKSPPSYGFPPLPPNWESMASVQANKPRTQALAQLASAAIFSGYAAQDPGGTGFSVAPYPYLAADVDAEIGYAIAPYGYWQRCLDSYTSIMQLVDQRIGEVLAALPSEVAGNTIIVFASDHGEYAGAHGLMSGKILTCYDEAFHVPLIVVDPSGRFTGDIDTVRTELTSSVDMLPLLVSLGHNGSRDWMTGRLEQIYGGRHDMLPMLRSASAAGRPYLLLATDELIPSKFNKDSLPLHIVGLRTKAAKLATYASWTPRTGEIEPETLELEYYDYGTPGGAAELANTPDAPEAQQMLGTLMKDLIPNELRAPLPGALGAAQALSKLAYLLVEEKVLDPNAGASIRDQIADLGYGREF